MKVIGEFSPLRKVKVATPGKEKEKLTPKNLQELQYAEIPDLVELQREHEGFKKAIIDAGVELLDIRNIFKNLERGKLLSLLHSECDLSGVERLESHELAEIILSGLSVTEAKKMGILSKNIVGEDEDLCVKPLVNIMFTRDPGMVMGDVYVKGKMRWDSRRTEPSILLDAISPNKHIEIKKGYFEGGDFMPIGEGRLLMGYGTRSSALGLNDGLPKLEQMGVLDEAVLVRL